MKKSDNSYKTIGEVVKILDLKNRSGQKTATHTIRFWEKEFSQVKPIILTGNRRYFDRKAIDLLKKAIVTDAPCLELYLAREEFKFLENPDNSAINPRLPS